MELIRKSLLGLALFFLIGSARAQGVTVKTIDYTYPEAFKTTTRIDVPLGGGRAVIRGICILTGSRTWRMVLTEGAKSSDYVVYSVWGTNPWKMDYCDKEANRTYQDRDGTGSLHFLVDPGGKYMIFRVVVEVELL